MRKNRLTFWIVSLVICACVIFAYYKVQELKDSVLPYEERDTTYVCSPKEFQAVLKDNLEKTSIFSDLYGNTHKVILTDDKKIANFILTDKITSSDDYEKVGWTPLIVVFDEDKNKVKAYKDAEYLIESDDKTYQINFQKLINDVESGVFKDNIYYPKLNTREGELFYDFLLINVNGGKYPDDKKMKEAKETVDSLLSRDSFIEADTADRLKTVMKVKNSLYIVFEKDVYEMNNSSYSYMISYPTETVVQEWYCCYKGDETEKLKSSAQLSRIMMDKRIRDNDNSDAYNYDTHGNGTRFYESDGYSYVKIPLKE